MLYQVTTPVQFPMKPPSDEDAAKLAASMPPYPREPFLKAEDEHVDVRYVLWVIESVFPGPALLKELGA